ncbi:MAG: thiamine phosphate synthase [Micromonosporaceae bacterium]|nr:thiamine phosphate synthase [Micromonosporaceae bacterium]
MTPTGRTLRESAGVGDPFTRTFGERAGLLVLTDRRQARRSLVEVVAAAVEGGARAVVLREKDLPCRERAALADHLRAILARVGGRLIVAGPDPLGGDAVHLAASDPASTAGLVGRSCHRPEDLARLSNEHYVTLSPVFSSPSKPGYGPALGTAGLARMCARTATPVFALGGVTSPDQAAACLAAGAAGVAVMGAVMRAADPAATVASLLERLVAG